MPLPPPKISSSSPSANTSPTVSSAVSFERGKIPTFINLDPVPYVRNQRLGGVRATQILAQVYDLLDSTQRRRARRLFLQATFGNAPVGITNEPMINSKSNFIDSHENRVENESYRYNQYQGRNKNINNYTYNKSYNYANSTSNNNENYQYYNNHNQTIVSAIPRTSPDLARRGSILSTLSELNTSSTKANGSGPNSKTALSAKYIKHEATLGVSPRSSQLQRSQSTQSLKGNNNPPYGLDRSISIQSPQTVFGQIHISQIEPQAQLSYQDNNNMTLMMSQQKSKGIAEGWGQKPTGSESQFGGNKGGEYNYFNGRSRSGSESSSSSDTWGLISTSSKPQNFQSYSQSQRMQTGKIPAAVLSSSKTNIYSQSSATGVGSGETTTGFVGSSLEAVSPQNDKSSPYLHHQQYYYQTPPQQSHIQPNYHAPSQSVTKPQNYATYNPHLSSSQSRRHSQHQHYQNYVVTVSQLSEEDCKFLEQVESTALILLKNKNIFQDTKDRREWVAEWQKLIGMDPEEAQQQFGNYMRHIYLNIIEGSGSGSGSGPGSIVASKKKS